MKSNQKRGRTASHTKAASRQRIFVWILSVLVAVSMICGFAVSVSSPRSSRTPTVLPSPTLAPTTAPAPTRTATPTSTPSAP